MNLMLTNILYRYFKSSPVITRSSRILYKELSLLTPKNNKLPTPTMSEATNCNVASGEMPSIRDIFVQNKSDNQMIISFNYDYQGKSKQFNMNRNSSENLSSSLERIKLNVAKLKKSKSKAGRHDPNSRSLDQIDISIDLLIDGNRVDSTNTKNVDAWVEGAILNLDGITYQVKTNCPLVESISLPSRILSNFIAMPSVKLLNCAIDTSRFSWYRRVSRLDRDFFDETDLAFDGVYYWYKVGSGVSYCPTDLDLGRYLKLTCIPSNLDKMGPEYECLSKAPVELGPTDCPFQERHNYISQIESDPDSLRIVTYNILADLYADSDYSRTVLFRHCPSYALEIDYRRQLLLKEIAGYKADLILLQEVDKKEFNGAYQPYFHMLGYQGIFDSKKGGLPEGTSTFYCGRNFDCIETHKTALTDLIDPFYEERELIPEAETVINNLVSKRKNTQDEIEKTNKVSSGNNEVEDDNKHPILKNLQSAIAQKCLSKFNAIREAIDSNPRLKKRFMSLRTIIQTTLLKVAGRDNRYLLVANTHLYFAPDADHIRLLQGSTCVKYLEFLKNYYYESLSESTSSRPSISLIFCGDMNSTPECGLYKLLTGGQVDSDLPDWSSKQEERVLGLSLETDLRFDSAYKGLSYTNYTPDFNGCLDYIYIEQDDCISLKSTVPLPTHEEVAIDGGLPSRVFPSDHIALIADVKVL